MNAISIAPAFSIGPAAIAPRQKEQFRLRFQRSLRACVRRGFSIEESFGMIWEETWDEISLTEREQSELYEELINWAKNEPVRPGY